MFLCHFLFHSVGVSSTVNSALHENQPNNRFLLHFQLPFNFIHRHFDLLEGLDVPNTYFSCNLFSYHLAVRVLSSFPVPPVLSSSVAVREGSYQIGAAKAIPGLARNIGHVCVSKTTAGLARRRISEARNCLCSIRLN